jgi:DNA-binding MarR family transcriptional regulator
MTKSKTQPKTFLKTTEPMQLEDARQNAKQKSLLHPLSWLATDFRDQIRAGLRDKGHQLEPSYAGVIIHLDLAGSRLTDLADRAGMTKQAMGKLVDELEAVGYVYRIADPIDGRAKVVCFSSSGIKLLQDSETVVNAIWQSYAELIGEENLIKLRDQLEDLAAKVKQKRKLP